MLPLLNEVNEPLLKKNKSKKSNTFACQTEFKYARLVGFLAKCKCQLIFSRKPSERFPVPPDPRHLPPEGPRLHRGHLLRGGQVAGRGHGGGDQAGHDGEGLGEPARLPGEAEQSRGLSTTYNLGCELVSFAGQQVGIRPLRGGEEEAVEGGFVIRKRKRRRERRRRPRRRH